MEKKKLEELCEEDLTQSAVVFYEHKHYKKALRFADPAYREKLEAYSNENIARLNREQEAAQREWENRRQAEEQARRDGEAQRRAWAERAEVERKDRHMQARWVRAKRPRRHHNCAAQLRMLGGYRDAEARAEHFEALAGTVTKKAAKRAGVVCAILAVLLAAAAFVVLFAVPSVKYKEAEALLVAEDYLGAKVAFLALGGFKDAPQQAQLARQGLMGIGDAYLAEGDAICAAIAYLRAGDLILSQQAFDFDGIILARPI